MARPRIFTAEVELLEAEARPIVLAYKRRVMEEEGNTPLRSSMPLLIEIVRRGVSYGSSSSGNPVPMTPRQQWIVSVLWVMKSLGAVSSHILRERLVGGGSSIQGSWSRIADDLEHQTSGRLTISANGVRDLYLAALPAFVGALRDRGITCDYGSATSPSNDCGFIAIESARVIDSIGDHIGASMVA